MRKFFLITLCMLVFASTSYGAGPQGPDSKSGKIAPGARAFGEDIELQEVDVPLFKFKIREAPPEPIQKKKRNVFRRFFGKIGRTIKSIF